MALHVMLVAGEASGDVLGARLMAALRARYDGAVRFSGIGGELMAAEGLDSLFPMAELSIMGLAEVLPRLPKLLRRIRETAGFARAEMPDALVTIDAPSFGLRVAGKLQGAGIPRIHYVAPQVWAWRPGRARHIAGTIDHLLALLPFEPKFFEDYGLPCTFVGHPVVENPKPTPAEAQAFRERHRIPLQAPVVATLPGSRHSEIARHLTVFAEGLEQLAAGHAGLQAVVATVTPIEREVREAVAQWRLPATVTTDRANRFAAFAACDVALAASGTASLELALAGVPSVIAYRTSRLTGAMVRPLLNVDHIALPNILAGRTVMPELIQERYTPQNLAAALAGLLDDAGARQSQNDALAAIARELGADGPPPSSRAADAVLEVIQRFQSRQA